MSKDRLRHPKSPVVDESALDRINLAQYRKEAVTGHRRQETKRQ